MEQFCPSVQVGVGKGPCPPCTWAVCSGCAQQLGVFHNRSEGATGLQGPVHARDTPCNALAEGVRQEPPVLDAERCVFYTPNRFSPLSIFRCPPTHPLPIVVPCTCAQGAPELFVLCPAEKGSGRGTCRPREGQITGRNPQQHQNSHPCLIKQT